jgi:hypothetical protein
MRLPFIALIFVLGFFTLKVFAEPTFLYPGRVQIQDIDIGFIGDINQPGWTWFAIHSKGEKWYLSKTTVQVNEEDGILDISSKYPDTIGLLRGTGLTEGPVESASSFGFRGQQYELVVLKSSMGRNDVYFSDGKNRMLVYGDDISGCEHPHVLWAGDIDRDGKPDMIAYFADDSEKSVSICVFLSSGAEKGQPLRNAGCQSFSG